MKRALVMSGGGARGAYEAGAWLALKELGVRVNAAYGTSVGAINAVMVAQDDPKRICALWDGITTFKALQELAEEDFSFDRLLARKRDILPFLLENAKKLLVDVTPLVNILKDNLSEERIRATGIDVGVMCFAIPSLTAKPMRMRDMKPGALTDWAIASASCYPLFPMKMIDGERYMDGGAIDNLPIGMAVEDSADEIVVIDIHPEPVHPEYIAFPFLKTISPYKNLCNFVDFSPETLRRVRIQGYLDAMKAYGSLDGAQYAFGHVRDLEVADAARGFAMAIARLDEQAAERVPFRSQSVAFPFSARLGAPNLPKRPSAKQFLLRGLENCMDLLQMPVDTQYSALKTTRALLELTQEDEQRKLANDADIRQAAEAGPFHLTGALYHRLRENPVLPASMIDALKAYPAQTVSAHYLHHIAACLRA